jgi:hypothetical protein
MERLAEVQREEAEARASMERTIAHLHARSERNAADAASWNAVTQGTHPSTASHLREMVSNPSALRDAVLLAEVLSQPLSERKTPHCPGLAG